MFLSQNIPRLFSSVSDGAGSNETRDPSDWLDTFASLSLSERLELFLHFVVRLPRCTFREVLSRTCRVLWPLRLRFSSDAMTRLSELRDDRREGGR